jgi:hypothetical protein
VHKTRKVLFFNEANNKNTSNFAHLNVKPPLGKISATTAPIFEDPSSEEPCSCDLLGRQVSSKQAGVLQVVRQAGLFIAGKSPPSRQVSSRQTGFLQTGPFNAGRQVFYRQAGLPPGRQVSSRQAGPPMQAGLPPCRQVSSRQTGPPMQAGLPPCRQVSSRQAGPPNAGRSPSMQAGLLQAGRSPNAGRSPSMQAGLIQADRSPQCRSPPGRQVPSMQVFSWQTGPLTGRSPPCRQAGLLLSLCAVVE